MASTEDNKPAQEADVESTARRPYATPALVEYGSVAKLTATKPGSMLDVDMVHTHNMNV